MSLNDQRDKLDVAEQYLLDYPANSQEFEAALEHLRWVYLNDSDSHAYIAQIIRNVTDRRRDEQHTMSKLRSFAS